jgi:hypothetical protein
MDAVIKALWSAARSFVHPIILAILLVPMGVALAIWIGVGWAYWDTWTSAIQAAVIDHASFSWTADWDVPRVAAWVAAAVVLAILAPIVILTAVLIATVFAMPVLVRHVAKSHYPTLELRHGGTVFGSMERPGGDIPVRAAVDRDLASLAAGTIGGIPAARAIGLPEPAPVPL